MLSMTGYGRHREVIDGRDILCEVKSVNSRYLDTNIKLGRMYNALEDKVNDFDQHLLPFDGSYNYEKMMRKLDEYGYAGSLMLEVSQHTEEYRRMTHEEFLATAYERIKKISQM